MPSASTSVGTRDAPATGPHRSLGCEVSVKWTPVSASGWTRAQSANAAKSGHGTITLHEVMVRRSNDLMVAAFAERAMPTSSACTMRSGVLAG